MPESLILSILVEIKDDHWNIWKVTKYTHGFDQKIISKFFEVCFQGFELVGFSSSLISVGEGSKKIQNNSNRAFNFNTIRNYSFCGF